MYTHISDIHIYKHMRTKKTGTQTHEYTLNHRVLRSYDWNPNYMRPYGSANKNHYTITRKHYRNYKMITVNYRKQYPFFQKKNKYSFTNTLKNTVSYLKHSSVLLQTHYPV